MDENRSISVVVEWCCSLKLSDGSLRKWLLNYVIHLICDTEVHNCIESG